MTYPRPHVVTDPAVRFGRPHIKGVSTEAIAGMVMVGESLAEVAANYDITVHEVILACWFEGTHGRYRKQWKQWAEKVAPGLAGLEKFDPDGVEEPPAKH